MKHTLKIAFAIGTIIAVAAAGYAAVRGKRAEYPEWLAPVAG